MNIKDLLSKGLFGLLIGMGCTVNKAPVPDKPFIAVLGVAQDAGYPQMGCTKDCCKRVLENPSLKRLPTSLALVDPASKKWWLFEATPDIKEQLELFRTLTDSAYNFLPDGIFLTHGHIGHYTGLMQLGREVMNSNNVPVYVMPRMKRFLTENGPWSQLVSLNNISLVDLTTDSAILMNSEITITPFLVPHRDEFTETVGFKMKVNKHQTVFIPDIDKWGKIVRHSSGSYMERNISAIVKESNLVLLDGTFYKDGELPGRPMSEVPHPFIDESVQLFSGLPDGDKKKIRFIHFNHTNPLLDKSSAEIKNINSLGFMVTKQGELILLE